MLWSLAAWWKKSPKVATSKIAACIAPHCNLITRVCVDNMCKKHCTEIHLDFIVAGVHEAPTFESAPVRIINRNVNHRAASAVAEELPETLSFGDVATTELDPTDLQPVMDRVLSTTTYAVVRKPYDLDSDYYLGGY